MGTTEAVNEAASAITEEAEHVSTLFGDISSFVKGLLPSLCFALIVLAVGVLAVKLLLRLIGRGLRRSRLEPTASSFLQSLVSVVLYVLVAVIVLSILNVPMASIIAVIGTMGLAIGLALQNSLSNVAGGFLILFSKPLKVGDFVEFDGITGTVESIGILQTKLRRLDGTSVFIPNGKISDAVVLNFSEDPRRRLDLEFGIAYDANAEKAKDLITAILLKSPYVLKDSPPLIRIGALTDSAVVLYVQVWTMHEHYWDLRYDLIEQVKASFDSSGIAIPYPQMDVHLDQKTS